jgi:hypothetical protein
MTLKKTPENKNTIRRSSKKQRGPTVKSDPWGCMAGTITIQPDVDLTAPSDEVWNSEMDQRIK